MFSLVGIGAVVFPVVPYTDRDALMEVYQKLTGEILRLLLVGQAGLVPIDVRVAPLAGDDGELFALWGVTFYKLAEPGVVFDYRFRRLRPVGMDAQGIDLIEQALFETIFEPFERYSGCGRRDDKAGWVGLFDSRGGLFDEPAIVIDAWLRSPELLYVRLVPDFPEDAFALVPFCGGFGEGGEGPAALLGTDGATGFIELVAVVEDVEDANASFGATGGQGIIADFLEFIGVFFPLDAGPGKVHSDELKAGIAD